MTIPTLIGVLICLALLADLLRNEFTGRCIYTGQKK